MPSPLNMKGEEDSAEVTAMKLHHITRDHEAETIAEATSPDQPKPAGEWTADRIRTFIPDGEAWCIGALADAINASITAAFMAGASKLKFEAEDELDQIGDLKKQLAAEREKVKTLVDALKVASEDLVCPSPNDTHYCPNCDNSLYNAKAKIDAALAKSEKK